MNSPFVAIVPFYALVVRRTVRWRRYRFADFTRLKRVLSYVSLYMLSHIKAWTQGRPLLPALRNSGRFLTIPLRVCWGYSLAMCTSQYCNVTVFCSKYWNYYTHIVSLQSPLDPIQGNILFFKMTISFSLIQASEDHSSCWKGQCRRADSEESRCQTQAD